MIYLLYLSISKIIIEKFFGFNYLDIEKILYIIINDMQEYNIWTSKTFFPKKKLQKKNVPEKSLPKIPTLAHFHIKKRFPIQLGHIKSPVSPVKFNLYKVASPKKGKKLSASAVEFVPKIQSPKKGKKLSASAVEFVPRF